MKDPTDLQAQQRARQAADIQRKGQEASDQKDFLEMIATPAGKRYLRRVIATCGVFQTTYTGNSETFFKEGRRSVGLELLDDVRKWAPELLGAILTGK